VFSHVQAWHASCDDAVAGDFLIQPSNRDQVLTIK
jgi:hypothetical protein